VEKYCDSDSHRPRRQFAQTMTREPRVSALAGHLRPWIAKPCLAREQNAEVLAGVGPGLASVRPTRG
jgi:hypothetical protein